MQDTLNFKVEISGCLYKPIGILSHWNLPWWVTKVEP